KTSLAAEMALGLLAAFPGGVWGVDLSAVNDAARAPAAIAAAIGVAGGGLDPGGAAGALPLVVEHLRDRRALLVLDNCEHLAARLDDRFRLLASARSGARERTLEDVVAWSHDLLSDDERAVFRRLAVFRSAFALADAEDVAAGGTIATADVADLLAALVERSM